MIENSINVREAVLKDLEQIIALLIDDVLGQRRENMQNIDLYERAFQAICADENHYILVAEKERTLVGCIQISYIPNLTFEGSWRAQLEGVRVHQAYRKKGIGKLLVNEAFLTAEKKGCKIVQLITNLERKDAILFYESLGFEGSHLGMKLHLTQKAKE